MKTLNLLAFDFGASSGRGILGKFDGNKLSLEEIHRFSNEPVQVMGHMHWDILRLFWDVKKALAKYKNNFDGDLTSIGIDTWGVDFGLLDKDGDLLGNPYHYRDDRTEGMMELAFSKMPKREIFDITGIAFQKFNTLFQLIAMAEYKPELLEKSKSLLFMPDLLAYFLTGEKSTEYTEASTGQLLDARARTWSSELINTMGLPMDIFTSIQEPGTIKGKISSSIDDMLGIGQIPLVSVATHDTGSAVVAVPALEGEYAYLSSGTWSLMGLELDEPVINGMTFNFNYTNEGGINGKYRLLKNIMGLWIEQECKREWDRQGEVFSHNELEEMAMEAKAFKCFIDPDHDTFYSPGNMPQKIQEFCKSTGQYVPETKGEIIRCVFESLAMKYRWSIERLEEIRGRRLDVLHIVGGGSKNKLLNQLTSDAINRPVICGPTEATATGNLLVQAMAMGELSNLREIREIVARSFPREEYLPNNPSAWDAAYEDYMKINQ